MGRGAIAKIGTERTAQNGYTYVKLAERGWVLKHWVIWEQANGRQIDPAVEQVRFFDGDRTNIVLENIVVIPKGKVQLRAKIARLELAEKDIQAQLEYYRRLLHERESAS